MDARPEREIENIEDFLDDYFRGEEFKELIESGPKITNRNLSSFDPELVAELNKYGVPPQEFLNFLKVRDRVASSDAAISVTTHIATKGLSGKVANLLLDGSVSKKIQDYTQ